MLEVRQQYAGKFIKGPILDIGCGDGKLLDHFNGVGFELDEKKADAARDKGHTIFTYDVEKLKYEGVPTDPSRRFQHVVLTDVIEHFEDPVAVLTHIRKNQMAYGGSVIITTPNCGWLVWEVYAKLGGHPHAWRNPEHTYCFTPESILSCLKEAGFTKFKFNSYGKIPKINIHFKTPIQLLACNIVVEAK